MRKGSLDDVLKALRGTGGEEISVPDDVADRAEKPLRMMLELA
jgi:quinolinate synthase